MPERPKGHDWKSCIPLITGSWVRLPLSPPRTTQGSWLPCTLHGARRHKLCNWDRVHGSPELSIVQGVRIGTYMYYVYVLRSQFDGKLYIGYTANLRNRMQEHNNGQVTSTKSRRPLELIFYEGYKSMGDAKRREHYFKTAKGKSSLNMMLRNSLKTSTI